MIRIKGLPISFRTPGPDDLAFVFDAWVESFRMSHAAGIIPMDMYRDLYREVVRRLMIQSVTLVAYNDQKPVQLLGFITFDREAAEPIIHYSFVKHFMRRNGLATALCAEAGIDPKEPFVYTFKSRVAKELTRSWTGAKFDPMVARRITTMTEEAVRNDL